MGTGPPDAIRTTEATRSGWTALAGVLSQERREHARARNHAAAREPRRQERPRPREPPRDGALRTAELRRGLTPRQAFEVAQHNRRAIARRQARQFLIEHLEEFIREVHGFFRGHVRQIGNGPLVSRAAAAGALKAAGGVEGHAVEPRAQRPARAERPGLANEHEERGLECVIGIGVIAEHAPADREHHRPVTPHHGREGVLIPRVDEAVEQLTVAAIAARELGEFAEVAHRQDLKDRMIHGGPRSAFLPLTPRRP